MKKIVSFIMCTMACMSTFANDEWTGRKNITYLKAQTNGIYFELEGFDEKFKDTEENSCGKGFLLSDESSNYETRASFLLAAYMSGKVVNISYASCANEYTIKAGAVGL